MAVFTPATLVFFDGAFVPFGDLTSAQQAQVFDAALEQEFETANGPQPNTTNEPVNPATNPEVTVTPVSTVPLSQVKTDAGGVPVTTPISGNAAALVEEGGFDPQQAVAIANIQTNPVAPVAETVPSATLVEEAGLDIQNNNPVAPDPFAEENAPPEPLARTITVPGDYSVVPNNNGSFDVVETQTGVTVASGLDRNEASVFAYEQSQIDTGVEIPNPDAEEVPNQLSGPTDVEDPLALFASQELDTTGTLAESLTAPNPYRERQAYDDDGNLNPGFTLDEDNNPVFVGNDFVEPATQASAAESRAVAAAVANARRQQTIADQNRQLNNLDWRVRLSLAANSNYLYNVQNAFILNPLKNSNGVIFPYTPTISTSYKANYSPYDLTHSNYRGYFYQNSYTDNVIISAIFTAQTTQEADYLLAVIHFFRSVTKMFYGQSPNLGSPPPMCFLTGLGEYQFNNHPVLVTAFNYNLPADVDYIRAGSSNNMQLNQNQLRNKQVETTNNSLRSVSRLANALLSSGRSLPKGAVSTVPVPAGPNTQNPTYVPTKMEMSITLLPVQSRQRVSQEFNLQEFANGNQLKGGFW